MAITNGSPGACSTALECDQCCNPSCDPGFALQKDAGGEPIKRCCHIDIQAGVPRVTGAAACLEQCTAGASSPVAAHGVGPGDCVATLDSGDHCRPGCAEGYALSGDRVCTAGTLNTVSCDPEPCTAMSIANSDHKTLHPHNPCTAVTGELCEYACNEGYSIVGTQAQGNAQHSGSTTCQSDHTFDYTAATKACVADYCPTGTDPPANSNPVSGTSGTCQTPTLQSGDSCQPECGGGFQKHGTDRTCEKGKYTSNVTCTGSPCECPGANCPTSPVSNGHGDNTGCPASLPDGQHCTPNCEAGYSPGSGDRTCVHGQLTDTATCDADACTALSIPHSDHGPAHNCTGATGDTCSFSCNEGYSIGGAAVCTTKPDGTLGTCTGSRESQVRCSASGWQIQFPTGGNWIPFDPLTSGCKADSCDASSQLEHMKSLNNCTSALQSGSTCRLTCEDHYRPSGGRTCAAGVLADDAVCGSPDPCVNIAPAPVHSKAMLNCPNLLPSGDSCTLECDTGYTPDGVRSCTASVLQNTFMCQPDPCTGPEVTHKGTNAAGPGDCSDPLLSGHSCTLLCKEPYYTPEGERTCLAGKLSVNSMECVRKRCSDAAVQVNTSHYKGNGSCTGVLRGGESCYPECDDGWYIPKEAPRTCPLDGGQLSSYGTCTRCTETECSHKGICVADPASVNLPSFKGDYICTKCDTGYYGERHCDLNNPCTVAPADDPCKTLSKRGTCQLDELSRFRYNCTDCDRFYNGPDCTFDYDDFTHWEYACIIATALSVLPVPFMICRFRSTLNRLHDPYLDDSKKSLGLWGLFMFLFGVVDLIVDVRMIWTLKTCKQDVLLTCGLVTFVTTTFMTWYLGYATLKHIVSRPGGGPAARRWLGKNVVTAPLIVLASSSRLNSMAILRLRICGCQLIDFPDSQDQRYFHFLKNAGMYHCKYTSNLGSIKRRNDVLECSLGYGLTDCLWLQTGWRTSRI